MPETGRMINHPNITTVELEAPVSLLPTGRGPIVHAHPTVACGPYAESVVVELQERAAMEARLHADTTTTTERENRR